MDKNKKNSKKSTSKKEVLKELPAESVKEDLYTPTPVKNDIKESKEEKFDRLFTNRVNKALKSISIIGNLANTNNYSFNVNKISKGVSVLQNELNSIEALFSTALNKQNKPTFSL